MSASQETTQDSIVISRDDTSVSSFSETCSSNGTKIKVIVRVRPLLPRESTDAECLVIMPADDPQTTQLIIPAESPYYKKLITKQAENQNKTYKFDESVWSYNANDLNYVSNRKFYEKSGREILEHIFQGYNVCLLAYGQTSSGKTYTMMGDESNGGVIPQLVRDLLKQKELLVKERINCEIKFSYMEIYNELTNDLLSTKSSDHKKCRVREHPVTGPYVENLIDYTINDYQDFYNKLAQGNRNRATAATGMNESSSRSHAILTLTLKQTIFKDVENNDLLPDEEIISNIKLVDLAGSERLLKTKVFGQHDRIKEGNLINKSLTVLGRCINMLATNLTNPHAKPLVIPFRDSILTYILKENLSGNSKTFMIFCISPIDFEETYQTLNYASQVKKISTVAKTNAKKLAANTIDWAKLQKSEDDAIASLKQEIETLTAQLNQQQVAPTNVSNLISFLETESLKLKFENKYLKQQTQSKDNQIAELNNHMDYLEREYYNLHQQYSNLQISTKTDGINTIFSQAKDNLTGLESALNTFDPNRIF